MLIVKTAMKTMILGVAAGCSASCPSYLTLAAAHDHVTFLTPSL